MSWRAANGSRYRLGAAIPLQPSLAGGRHIPSLHVDASLVPFRAELRHAAQMELARDYYQAGV